MFCVIWFTIFGDTAIWINDHVAGGALGALTGTPEKLLFRFLEYLPLPTLTGLVSLMVIALFFITSADSGISRPQQHRPPATKAWPPRAGRQ